MPAYEYSYEHNAFIKRCSCCKEITVGTDTNEGSQAIFLEVFSLSFGSAQSADGLQSRCWFCNNHSRRSLNITRQQLEEMYLKQGCKCAICYKPIKLRRNSSADEHAHVDHDESIGKVRELLCGNCNRGIGCLKHDPEILEAALLYLRRHNG